MATGTNWPSLQLNNWTGSDFVLRAEINENFEKIDTAFGATGHNHDGTAGNGPKITSSGLAAGAANDAAIGNRTVNDSTAQTAGAAGTLTTLLGQIGGVLKAITGKSAWYTAPSISLETLYTDTATKPAPTPINLVNGLQVVNNPQAGRMQDVQIKGRTLVNLLGREGNCEGTTNWASGFGGVTLDSTNKVLGSNGFKFTASGSQGIVWYIPKVMSTGKYYVALADVKNGNLATGIRIGISGLNQTAYVTDSTKFTTLITKVSPSDGNANIEIKFEGLNTQYGYVDAIRIYEVTAAEYAAITAGVATSAQIAKYPYVDDLKHTYAPTIMKQGEQILPPFTEWTNMAVNGVVNGDYSYNQPAIVPTGGWTNVVIDIMPNTDYYLQTGGALMAILDGTSVNTVSAYSTANRTINTGVYTQITVYIHGAGAQTCVNPMLNLGTTPKPFVPRNDDILAFPDLRLASNTDQSVYDLLYQRDDKFFVQRKFKSMVLDGSLTGIFNADLTGFKEVRLEKVSSDGIDAYSQLNKARLIKYDGKIITESDGLPVARQSSADRFAFGKIASSTPVGSQDVYLTIADTDSGWGESYTPTAQEIQAYFWGWKMFLWGQPNNTPYNGTGTKAWCHVKDTNIGSSDYVTSVPTGPTGNMYGWTPYRLVYQLATPTVEEVQPEGGVTLHEGLNQLEVGQGLIVREWAYPYADSSNAFINSSLDATYSASKLKRRTLKILDVYKNGLKDLKWTKQSDSSTYGVEKVFIPIKDYDPTAAYEVTYLALDQYLLSAPTSGVTASVSANLKTAVDALAINQADIDSRLTANESLARQLYAVPRQTTAAMTLYVDATNGADNGDGSYSKPFKTIQRAIDSAPKIVNHDVIINVAPGTYTEDVKIKGFGGGATLSILGDTAVSTSRSVSSITVSTCSTNVSIRGLNLTTTTLTALYCLSAVKVVASYLNIIGSAIGFNGVVSETSNLNISSSVISNRSYALIAHANGVLLSDSNTGTGNSTSTLGQYGGKISRNGVQPSGLDSALAGGINTQTSGVLNPWGDNTTLSRSHARAGSTSGQAISPATLTKVIFNTEYDDQLTEYDPVTGRFTAKKAGVYQINACIRYTSYAANTDAYIYIYQNGTQTWTNAPNVSSSGALSLPISGQVKLNAGDYVEIYTYNNSGSTRNLNAEGIYSYFLITQIA